MLLGLFSPCSLDSPSLSGMVLLVSPLRFSSPYCWAFPRFTPGGSPRLTARLSLVSLRGFSSPYSCAGSPRLTLVRSSFTARVLPALLLGSPWSHRECSPRLTLVRVLLALLLCAPRSTASVLLALLLVVLSARNDGAVSNKRHNLGLPLTNSGDLPLRPGINDLLTIND